LKEMAQHPNEGAIHDLVENFLVIVVRQVPSQKDEYFSWTNKVPAVLVPAEVVERESFFLFGALHKRHTYCGLLENRRGWWMTSPCGLDPSILKIKKRDSNGVFDRLKKKSL